MHAHILLAAAVLAVLALTSVMLTWRFSRTRQDIFPPQPAVTNNNSAEAALGRHQQRLNAAKDNLSRAIMAARDQNFSRAYGFLYEAADTLKAANNTTAELLYQATRAFVNACDANYGIAGRLADETMRRLSDLWPRIDGGEHAYRQIAGLCQEAMCLTPLGRIGKDGAEAQLVMSQARRCNAQEKSEQAMAYLTHARGMIMRSPVLRWHGQLREEVERTICAILEATTTNLNDEEATRGRALAFVAKFNKSYETIAA